MSLSIKYNPPGLMSAHDDALFVLLEDTKPFDSTTYPDYKYICDIYIYGILQARLKSFPRADDKLGVFNISNIVRNYLYTDFLPFPNQILAQSLGENSFYVNVLCRFGEEYSFTMYTNIIIDSQRSYFNHYNDRQFGTQTILPDVIDHVASTRPYATPIYRGSKNCFVPFIPSDDRSFGIIFRCYNSLGLIRTQTYTIEPTAGSSYEMKIINCAPAAVNSIFPGLIDDYIDYYTVEFNTTAVAQNSIIRFDLKCEKIYSPYTVHFLNKYGGFESRDFTKVSRRTIDIERTTFGQSQYLIKSDGTPVWFDSASKVYREQSSTYAVGWTEKMSLNTDLLNDAEYQWLGELFKSPMVYIEMNGYIYPMTITDTSYEYKKIVNDQLTNITMNIQFGDRFNAQYR